jgi:hypothetical protein
MIAKHKQFLELADKPVGHLIRVNTLELSLKFIIIFFALVSQTFAATTPTLKGLVTGKECPEKMSKLWISEVVTNQLIFQADVPINSSFEAKLIPGKYKVVLNNQKGCSAEETIEVKTDDKKIQKEFVLKIK